MSYLKSLVDKLLVHIIFTVLITLGASITTFIVGKKYQFSSLEITLFIILIILLALDASYLIYRLKNGLTIFDPMDYNFRILKEERIHKWINADTYVHKRKYRIKALRNNLDYYTDKFLWTGPEYKLLEGEFEGYSIKKEATPKNVFVFYNFKFARKLKKGSIIELEASWEAKGPASAFFSSIIEEPTDLLVMTVMLYPGSGVKVVNCEIEKCLGAKDNIFSKEEKLNSDGEYSWPEKKPKLGHTYEINWIT